MKKTIQVFAFIWILIFGTTGITSASSPIPEPLLSPVGRGGDSLRIGAVIHGLNVLHAEMRDSIAPKLTGETRVKVDSMVLKMDMLLKSASTQFKDSMMTDFSKLSAGEKKLIKDLEHVVGKILLQLPQKSIAYHQISLAYLPVYNVQQELRTDGRTPLLATYWYPYDPNTTDNNQVIIAGAFLNFYLEYRIRVGGIEMGPDVVDKGRLVFTFPEKLLKGQNEPFWVEVEASPMKQSGSGKAARFENHVKQHCYVLVFPKKK